MNTFLHPINSLLISVISHLGLTLSLGFQLANFILFCNISPLFSFVFIQQFKPERIHRVQRLVFFWMWKNQFFYSHFSILQNWKKQYLKTDYEGWDEFLLFVFTLLIFLFCLFLTIKMLQKFYSKMMLFSALLCWIAWKLS
jgi:hypothetical protein